MSQQREITGDSLFLGIDLGTTSVKVCLVDTNGTVHSEASHNHHADIKSTIGESGFEQDPKLILSTLQKCLADFSIPERQKVVNIGITGQMHGIMFWSSKLVCKTSDNSKPTFSEKSNNGNLDLLEMVTWMESGFSQLFTWQDQRCTSDFLSTLPAPQSHLPLATGQGNATLFWLCRHQPQFLSGGAYDSAGTIMDFLVALLCRLQKPLMTSQLAASWGYFDCKNSCWNKSILEDSDFPTNLLPDIIDTGKSAGVLQFDWLDIPTGVPVLAALGDVQCAMYSIINSPTDAALNMSTSCQLAFPVQDQNLILDIPDASSTVQYFPYFGDQYLAIAASLNGGNVLTVFVQMLMQWMQCFDCSVSESVIWEKLLHLSSEDSRECSLHITPTIFGERHAPDQRGQITGMTSDDLDLGSVFRAVCRGLLDNLCKMMPPSFLVQNNIKRIIGTGSVLSKNVVMRQEVASHYGKELEVVFGDSSDSATGVAIYASKT